MTRLTRRYRFSASHVLARTDWPSQRNDEVYGKCANPSGHGHNYALEVTLRGEVDPEHGVLLGVDRLDEIVDERVTRVLGHRLLNRLTEFEKDVPTAENIARVAWRALVGRVSPAELDRVRLVETTHNSVEYVGGREDTPCS